MLNRWQTEQVSGLDELAQLVYQSRQVGLEESLVLWGGGNNSIKSTGQDLLGQSIPVMYIKGSGSDMKSIVAREYPVVRLDWVAPLQERPTMEDDEMVDYLARCLLDPKSPRPSIETLLHAFLPFPAVLHTHADAILALTNTGGREATVRECFGNEVAVVPYLRPGFEMSRLVGQAIRQNMATKAIILMNHGLITWGETSREAYERHIEIVSRAEEFVRRSTPTPDRGETSPTGLETKLEPEPAATRLAPVLRGLLSQSQPVIMCFDNSPAVLDFLARPEAERISQVGPVTPDHLMHTRRTPLFVRLDTTTSPDQQREQLAGAIQQYLSDYGLYFEKHAPPSQAMLDSLPRIILVPGLGMWTVGRDARAAETTHDIYRHTLNIISQAQQLGGYATLDPQDAFDAEYWPLELYKLTLQPKDKELARRIALVTGAASGIGRAIALRLAEEGAHVVVTDIDESGAAKVAAAIRDKQGMKRAIGLPLDVTSPASVAQAFDVTCQTYGGLDILVSNAGIAQVGAIDKLSLTDWERSLAVNTTGHFLVVRAALDIMKAQRTGGSLVFNATKNVTAPGKDFGAYSVAKAAEAQLCRIVAIEGGEFGIRANMLNPDAIFEGSGLWSEELKQQRAQAYGLSVEKLADFYRQRNLLKAEVTAEDVAEAALFLAGPRSAKTTGSMLPVDGGVKEAFPR